MRIGRRPLSRPISKLANRQVLLPGGLGCEHYDNCFTCPYKDCRIKTGNVVNLIVVKDEEEIKRYVGV